MSDEEMNKKEKEKAHRAPPQHDFLWGYPFEGGFLYEDTE